MIDLKNINLLDIMPESIKNDEKVQAAAKSIDIFLQSIVSKSTLVLLLHRLDELPEVLVDELAWQFHVDFYEYELPIEQKRELVRQSILWHRKKGTPYAVEAVVSVILQDAKIIENWEYSGNPYCFKVNLVTGPIADEKTIARLYRAIMITKNTRSWLDGVEFIRNIDQPIYYMGAVQISRTISIYPIKFTMPDINANPAYAGAVSKHKEVKIWLTGTA